MPEALAKQIRPGHADALQTIIDFLPSGVTLFDPDLQMIACNEQFKRLLDFPAAMFEGGLPAMHELAIFNARRGDYGPGVPDVLAQQVVERARGMQAHVFERTRPNGTVLEIRGEPLPDGSGFVTIYTDITDRKRAEQEAKRYATYLDTVLNTLPQGVTVVDENLELVLWNQRFVGILGLPPDLMCAGRRFEDVIRYNAERGDYGSVNPDEKVRQVLDLALRFEPHRMERTRPQGQTIEIEGRPMQVEGKVAGFVSTYTDITELKQVGQYEQYRSHTLELLAGGEPLPVILDAIVRGLEQLKPAMLCSILLLDGERRHLGIGAAPSLPDFYNAAIDGIEIGIGVGCCGTAAFTGERVIVDDIATHPYWKPYKELAASAGLGACWSQPIRSASGQVLGTLAIYHRAAHTPAQSDIALIEQSARLAAIAIERSVAAEKMRDSEALYRLLTEDVLDVFWKTDRDFRFTYISPADQLLRGYSADEVIGHHVFEMFTEEGVATVTAIMQQRQEPERAGTQPDSRTFEVQHRCKDGRLIWGEVFSTPERDAHGTITGYHGITREITQRKQMEDQVRQLAFYDPLTDLPNRRLLNDRLSQALAAGKRCACHGALMFIDLDNFKPLNDTHGHVVGDLLLIEVAHRLKNCVRATDTVARLGGDEFVVMLSELNADKAESTSQAGLVAEKIRTLLSEPYLLAISHDAKQDTTVEHHCTASIGVVVFINHEGSHDDILKWADAAMYEAKQAGRNLVRCYDSRD
ncbi:MAG: PAS-domain containing protein [Oxalobacteraceae bacterium]|nr:PAS-domain containing protein [Oxalobacteraceae bacterium]